jgi:hypothetical protein
MATPTLSDLQTACARDLRDTNKRTFKDPDLTDLINAGVEEVGRVYPREMLLTIAVTPGTYDIDMPDTQQVVRVESWRNGNLHVAYENGADEASSQIGWEFWAGSLRMPKGAIDGLNAADSLRIWGYQGYPQLVAPTDDSLLPDSAEWGVRRYVRATAYQQLHGDRALFKQWQAQSQNSDVSMNMLSQMVAFYVGEWDRTRNHLRRLRRV